MTQKPLKAVCIDENWTNCQLARNKQYEITHIHGSEYVRVIDDTGNSVCVAKDKFEVKG